MLLIAAVTGCYAPGQDSPALAAFKQEFAVQLARIRADEAAWSTCGGVRITCRNALGSIAVDTTGLAELTSGAPASASSPAVLGCLGPFTEQLKRAIPPLRAAGEGGINLIDAGEPYSDRVNADLDSANSSLAVAARLLGQAHC